MCMNEGENLGSSILYEELLQLLHEELIGNQRAFELAKALVDAFRLRGAKGVREEIRRIIKQVTENASEAEKS